MLYSEHSSSETPPRAWRRPDRRMGDFGQSRNTSTGVEKTPGRPEDADEAEKHLHGRGEDRTGRNYHSFPLETPPRAWRRQNSSDRACRRTGNTSTGVEKTPSAFCNEAGGEKHLHGRGEDSSKAAAAFTRKETPPRAWRRPAKITWPRPSVRNTSTGVEKTTPTAALAAITRKHLHGRGEDSVSSG